VLFQLVEHEKVQAVYTKIQAVFHSFAKSLVYGAWGLFGLFYACRFYWDLSYMVFFVALLSLGIAYSQEKVL